MSRWPAPIGLEVLVKPLDLVETRDRQRQPVGLEARVKVRGLAGMIIREDSKRLWLVKENSQLIDFSNLRWMWDPKVLLTNPKHHGGIDSIETSRPQVNSLALDFKGQKIKDSKHNLREK